MKNLFFWAWAAFFLLAVLLSTLSVGAQSEEAGEGTALPESTPASAAPALAEEAETSALPSAIPAPSAEASALPSAFPKPSAEASALPSAFPTPSAEASALPSAAPTLAEEAEASVLPSAAPTLAEAEASALPSVSPAPSVAASDSPLIAGARPATGISLDREALSLWVGEEAFLTAVVAPEDADNRTVLWRSSDDSVLTVADGLVAAVGAGEAEVVAEAADGGFVATCRVTVRRKVSEIVPADSELALGKGEKRALAFSCLPEDATPELSYSSSDRRVVTVSASGVVTAKGTGRAVIEIKDSNGATARVPVRVWKAPKSVSLSAERGVIGVGEALKLTVGFPKGTGGGYAFSSSDEKVAKIDGETVVARAPGTTKITVRAYNGATKKGKLTVLPAPEGVTLDRTELSIGVGDRAVLTATLSAGSAGACAFSSADPGIAKVDPATGKVEAVAIGTTEVAVATYNGKRAVCAVTVLPAPTSVSLSAAEGRGAIGVGERVSLIWTFDAGSAGSVAFSISDARLASVNKAGVVTGKRPGSVTVYGKTHNGLTAQVRLTVRKAPKSVSLSAERSAIGVGETLKLSVKFPKGTGGGYEFSSSDEKVAKIDGDTVVALAPGTAKIAVKTYNGATKKGKLTVLPAPEGVTLDRTELSIGVGDRAVLTATLSAGSAGACAFSSADPGIAKVDPLTGKVEAVAAGTTEIAAITYNGKRAVCAVTVLPAPTAVALCLPEGHSSIGVGERLALETILSPVGSAGSVTYKSSDARCVAVDARGVVTGKKVGRAVVYATAHNGKKAKLTVSVKKAPGSVSLSLERTVLGAGEEATYGVKLPAGCAGQVTVSSDDESVARVEGGRVVAIAPGTAVITATSFNGKSRAVTLRVVPAPVDVRVSPETAVIGAGDSATLSAALTEGSAGRCAFASDDPSVATVEPATGVVVAVAAGEATVSVTAYNGVTASAQIRVVAAPDKLNLVSPAAGGSGGYALDLEKRGAFQIAPDMGGRTHLGISYESSDPGIASVSASGLVTARASGKCVIAVTAYNGASVQIRVTVSKWVDRLDSDYAAHAMGGLDGKVYTNSREAFLKNYAAGCRVFECDLSRTSDGEIVIWHNWRTRINSETPVGYVPTLEEFMGMKIGGKYTPLSYRDLLKLMKEYPDAQFLFDSKVRTPEAASELYGEIHEIAEEEDSLDACDRMIVYVYSKATFRAIDGAHHFGKYVYAFYLLEKGAPSAKRFQNIAAFCDANGIDVIALDEGWWDAKYLPAMKKSDVAVGVHTVNAAPRAKKLLGSGVSLILTDWLIQSER